MSIRSTASWREGRPRAPGEGVRAGPGQDHRLRLPVRRVHYTDGSADWESGRWFIRSERMYLIPGDSPIGYRLPLDSIPWVAKSDYPFEHPEDPWAERRPLPDSDQLKQQRWIPGMPEPRDPVAIANKRSATKRPRTAGANAFPSNLRATAAAARAALATAMSRASASLIRPLSAPPCARRLAMACCACSCRRSGTWKTSSN